MSKHFNFNNNHFTYHR